MNAIFSCVDNNIDSNQDTARTRAGEDSRSRHAEVVLKIQVNSVCPFHHECLTD